MELTSSAINKHGTISSMTTLYIRHGKAASQYRDLANTLESASDNKTLLNSLISYHSKAELNFSEWLNELPKTPVKPNTDMQLNDIAAIPTVSASTLAKNLKENEESFLQLYKSILNNNSLPAAIKQAIQAQSERVQQVIEKLDRIHKTGKERNMQV